MLCNSYIQIKINVVLFIWLFQELDENEVMRICKNDSGGVCSEALLFFYSDAQLWLDTENSLEWLEAFVMSNDLSESCSLFKYIDIHNIIIFQSFLESPLDSLQSASEALFAEVLAIAEAQLK